MSHKLGNWDKAYCLFRALKLSPEKATKMANIALDECRPEPDDQAMLLKAKESIKALVDDPDALASKCDCPVCSAGGKKPKPPQGPVIKLPELDDEEPKPNNRIEFN